MKIFKNKFLVKLIASICLILVLMNLTGMTKVEAKKGDDDEVWGSVLLKPITRLIVGLGDGILSVVHRALLEQKEIFYKISGDGAWRSFWKKVLVGVVIIVAIVVTAFLTYGASVLVGAVAAKCALFAGAVGASIVRRSFRWGSSPIDLCRMEFCWKLICRRHIFTIIFNNSRNNIFKSNLFIRYRFFWDK